MSYDSSDISVYDDVTHVRKFPFMYLGGDVRTTGAREVVDNAIDEARRAMSAPKAERSNYANSVSVLFHEDNSIEVRDNGRGVPFDYDSKAKINGIVKALGTARSGANFNTKTKGATTGTHGIGTAAQNFISSRFDVTVFRDGKAYRQQFKQGRPGKFKGDTFDPTAEFTPKPDEKLKPLPKTDIPDGHPTHGTWIRFAFDNEVESGGDVDIDMVIKRAIIATALTPGLKLTTKKPGEEETTFGPVTDPGSVAVLKYETGQEPLASFDAEFTFDKTVSTSDQRVTRPGTIDVAVTPCESGKQDIISSVNAVYTPGGGSHVTGTQRGIGDTLANRSTRGLGLEPGENPPSADDYMAVVSIAVSGTTPEPGFVGQEKYSVKNVAMGNAIERELRKQVTAWVVQPANADALNNWTQAALAHARERRRVQEARTRARQPKKTTKGLSSTLALPDKLVNCKAQGRGSGAELHLCEGDSALGTVANARFSDYQAVFPLRGKPLNVIGKPLGMTKEQAKQARAKGKKVTKGCRDNQEFSDIEAILGCGVRENCDPEKCRFDRIIFTTDGDVDGYHISALLMLMFYENFRPLIEEGMVYVSMPPLHVLTVGKGKTMKKYYAIDDEERDELYASFIEQGIKKSDIDIQRCKGLGEMDAKDFRHTVMNPQTRNLIHVRLGEHDADMLASSFDNKFAEERRNMITRALETGEVDAGDMTD